MFQALCKTCGKFFITTPHWLRRALALLGTASTKHAMANPSDW